MLASQGTSGAAAPRLEETARIKPTEKLRTMRQKLLFEFGMPTIGKRHEQGFSKSSRDFQPTPEHSHPWGDSIVPGKDIEQKDLFRVWCHNVNGISSRRDSTDLKDFANTMRDKGVTVFGIQETNRNFEKRHLSQSFHGCLRSVSKHHKGAVSSAQIQ
jgi:hypothetical protein